MPETIIDEYAQITFIDAQRRLGERFSAENGALPPLNQVKARRLFDSGDHWQKGDGFIGQLPTIEDEGDRLLLLEKAFTPEEVISEVLDTHIQNVLGDEAVIGIKVDGADKGADLDSETADILEAVKEWADKRELTKVMADALRGVRRDSAHVLRAFIPSGMIDGEGRIQAKDLRDALSKIWIRSELIEFGGVIVDEATATELGLMLYKMKIGTQDVRLCEYAYVDQNERTVWGTASENAVGAEIAEPFMLNGALPIYQMTAPALITESVCQAQRAINLSGTMLTRNNNLAGSRERLAVGVQPPGEWVESIDATTGVTTKTFTAAAMKTGPATMNFLAAQAVYDTDGAIKSLANPNIIFTDPVPVDTFLETSKHWRTVIYSKAKMLHLLMSDNATASGKSRIEARKEFQSSLNESKEIVDPAGKWAIEVALNIAAHFINAPGKYANLNATYNAQIATVELTPEEMMQIRSDYEAGIIDLRKALELRGYKDVDDIINRQSHSMDEKDALFGEGVTLDEFERRLDVANKGEGILSHEAQLRIVFPQAGDGEIAKMLQDHAATDAVNNARQLTA